LDKPLNLNGFFVFGPTATSPCHKVASAMEGLFRRGGVWWARLVVPAQLRSAGSRRELVRSTGTSDQSVAKVLAAVLLARWRKQLLHLEQQGMQDEALLRLIEGGPALFAQQSAREQSAMFNAADEMPL
jgi:hypothetical protein